MMIFEQDDPAQLRTYQEKRDLVGQVGYAIKRFDDPFIADRVADYMARMTDIFRPFDYGRFEFRVDHATGDARLPEVNRNSHLWSEQLFSRYAVIAGVQHAELIEMTVDGSIIRPNDLQTRWQSDRDKV